MVLRSKMPSINDPEDSTIPEGLPPVIDAHVHIFPRSIFSAIWKWFDDHAWKIRYQMPTTRHSSSSLYHREVKEILPIHAHTHDIAESPLF